MFGLMLNGINTEDLDDWQQYRHDPQHTSYTDSDLPENLFLTWEHKVKLPSIGEDEAETFKIYSEAQTTYHREKLFFAWEDSLFVFNPDTGRIIWSYSHNEPVLSPWIGPVDEINGIANYEDLVVATFLNGDLIVFNEENGNIFWEKNFSSPFSGESLGIPIIEDGIIYVVANERIDIPQKPVLFSIKIENGDINWNFTGKITLITPSVSKEKVYLQDSDNLYALDKRTGEVIWSIPSQLFLFLDKVISQNKRVFIQKTPGPFIGSPHILCLDAENGREIWKLETNEGIAAVHGSHLLLGKRIVDIETGGEILSLNKNEIGEDFFHSKIWARKKILLFGRKKTKNLMHILILYDLEKKTVIWKYEREDIYFISSIIAGNKLFTGTSDGRILAFTDPESLIPRADKYMKEKDYESALFLYEKAREYYEEEGNSDKIKEIEEKIGEITEESEKTRPKEETKIKQILIGGLGFIALMVLIIYFRRKKSQVKK